MKRLQLFIILLIFKNSCSENKINNINTNNEFGAPSLISPSNDTTNVSTILLLDWSDVTDASSYTIQIALDSQFINVSKDTTLINSIYSTYNGLLSNNLIYYWRVRAQNQSQTSTWSSVWNFKTSNFNNQYIIRFDSIGVNEDSAAFFSFTGMDLLNGRTTLDTSGLRDCSLNDVNNLGIDFYLQNGQFLDKVLPSGYEIRFFRVDPSMSVQSFDTLSKIYTTGHDSLRAVDFTEDGTSAWGYFNAPMYSGSSQPVYCFWLKGKKEAGLTLRNVYGIIQPREATDNTPFLVYGYRMSFRVRININGDNNF